MEKEKKNSGLVILVVLLVVIILGLVGYICYDKEIIFSKEEVKDEVKEKEINFEDTNITLVNDLNQKIAYMDKISDSSSKSGVFSAYFFRNSDKDDNRGNIFNNLTNYLKLQIVLDSLLGSNSFNSLSYNNENRPLIADYVKTFGRGEVLEISQEEVEKEYKRFFGTTKVDHMSSKENCFGYIYDKEIKTYYRPAPTCGGSTDEKVLYYKNRYMSNGDNAYVYVNYGLVSPTDLSTRSNWTVYTDINSKNQYKTNLTENEATGFKIDESNYKEFDEYKYTFKKDTNGNYYFVSLEKE